MGIWKIEQLFPEVELTSGGYYTDTCSDPEQKSSKLSLARTYVSVYVAHAPAVTFKYCDTH